MSRVRLANVLGVSPTSVQNWETGRVVATAPIQQRLASILKDGAGAIPSPAPRALADGGSSTAITTTATIITSYLDTLDRPITQDALVELVRSVRGALS